MKPLKIIVLASAAALFALTSISCKKAKKNEPAAPMSSEMHQNDVNQQGEVVHGSEQNSAATAIVTEYLSIKDALVGDSTEEAADAGRKLVTALEGFDVAGYSDSERKDLLDLIADAKKQAELISESSMEQQREHFKNLNKDVTQIIAITGTKQKMYEHFCPMYDSGSAWLSASNEVRNPYFGRKMLTCGKVRREIN